ncbi:DNA-3-methyladenine glycosylase 2 family protein [Aestuariispira insulae]|nr:DNA-3-methyladenine glycosylase 2 [Aestuariispira insulae]
MTNLDQDICYQALKTKDARFDGRFFTAVTSTGVFCRTICPATVPKRANCVFYPSAAAAMNAGYRPCLRCRPETAPGSPAWKGVSTTVNRALKLINEGALDEGGVEELASRLGIGERYLRRLFLDHLGASPKAVAQTRRLLFAKKLVTESHLPLTEIAFAAGFGSIRRFNDAFVKLYKRAPRDLRRETLTEVPANEGTISLKLSYRPPYDWDRIIGFLAARAITGLEAVSDGRYHRAIQLEEKTGLVSVKHDPQRHQLIAEFSLPDITLLRPAIDRIRRLFDLDTDIGEITSQLGKDPHLSPLIKAYPGLRVPGAWDLFELSVRAVLGQQITVAAAATFAKRIVSHFGTSLDIGDRHGITHTFPSPEILAKADLTSIGLTQRRSDTINGLARAFAEDQLKLEEAGDLADIHDRLCQLKGIGPWTAQYIALRALKEPDAFPESDLGLIRAIPNGEERICPKDLLAMAENWRPWRAYAAQLLWSADPGGPELKKNRTSGQTDKNDEG